MPVAERVQMQNAIDESQPQIIRIRNWADSEESNNGELARRRQGTTAGKDTSVIVELKELLLQRKPVTQF